MVRSVYGSTVQAAESRTGRALAGILLAERRLWHARPSVGRRACPYDKVQERGEK